MSDPPSRALLGDASVQRVDVRSTIALVRCRVQGATLHVLLAATSRGASIGLLRERPFRGVTLPGAALPPHELRRWRAALEGGRVIDVHRDRLRVRRGERAWTLCAISGAIALREDGGGEEHGAIAIDDEDALIAAGEALAADLGANAIEDARRNLARALARAEAKITRRIEAIQGDLGRIDEARARADRASLFVAEASRAPRGARSITVTDWSSGEPTEVTLPLDPARSARDQIDAMFKRHKRLQLGASISHERLAAAERSRAAVREGSKELAGASTLAAIVDLSARTKAAAPRDFAHVAHLQGPSEGGAKRRASEKSLPYRTFTGAGGALIFVGKGAAGNDALTFHAARPHDHWLHAKGRTGAHVIVPLDKGKPIAPALLLEAAHLAAHFSEARGEGVVEVEHTERRYLRKPKGSAPGFVVVNREKVIVLRVSQAVITAALATEQTP